MERMVRSGLALALTAIILHAGMSQSADIRVRGSWVETVDENDLVGGPGSALNSTYESTAGQMVVRIGGVGNRSWRVDVRKVDTNWHPDLRLFIRRTSDGGGPGTISGGTSYQEVTDTYQPFFSGSRNRSNIGLQERITGVSIQVPCDTYETTVYYTVVETN